MKKPLSVFLLAVLVLVLAGCANDEKKAENVVYYTLNSVLTINDRPLSNKIVDITYEHTGRNKPWEKTAYYIRGYVTVRRAALKDFEFRGKTVPKGSSQDYKYYYEARVVKGVKHDLVLVPSGLTVRMVDG
jgi:hypothetical protein